MPPKPSLDCEDARTAGMRRSDRAEDMSTEAPSVLIAALAVIVSALLQFLTIRMTRKTTLSDLRASTASTRAERLRETLGSPKSSGQS